MFKRFITVVGAVVSAAAAFASPSFAQQAATADQITAAKAHADAVIARSQAGDFFVNITSSDTPQVRHVRSGMVCSFTVDDPRDSISFYPATTGGPPHGDDASCASWWGTTFVSMFATRYPQHYSAEQVLAAAAGDIHRNWQNVKPFAESFPIITLDGQETPLAAAFTAERDAQPRSTMVLVRNIDGWTFKARATGPVDDPEVTKVGSMAFALSIPGGLEIYNRQR